MGKYFHPPFFNPTETASEGGLAASVKPETVSVQWAGAGKCLSTLNDLKFNSSPLKIANPKRKTHLPTIIFQGRAVKFRGYKLLITVDGLPFPEFNSSPLKKGGWKTTFLSYWAMLNFGRVYILRWFIPLFARF